MLSTTSVFGIRDSFRRTFGADPQFTFVSPGRINLIGEHIDYNDGFVLPAAIDKAVYFSISLSEEPTCCTFVAEDLNDSVTIALDQPVVRHEKMWVNYILGVISQLQQFPISGIDVVFGSTIPMGAGLSSSAALECGVAYAFNSIFQLGLTKKAIAQMGQKAEHTFVGVQCGIMDQFASVFGLENQFILLDCKTMDYSYIRANLSDYSLVLLDSKVKHTHLTSGYNTRREEVAEGLNIIHQYYPEINSFRDCNEYQLQAIRPFFSEVVFKRCLFVIREIKRVHEAVDALKSDDFETLGKLMLTTHEGLSKEYEVSCAELDFLVTTAQQNDAVIGSRMMGGGFGGCSINLIRKGQEEAFIAAMKEHYTAQFGITLLAYPIAISSGTHQFQKHEDIR